MLTKKVFFWETASTIFIIFFGSFLHFVYELSGNAFVAALFTPVNESVWEHLKLGFWALTVFMVIEYLFVNKIVKNFFIAKLIGIISMEVTIIIIFYSYTSITKHSILAIDISSFILGAIVCQIICAKIYQIKSKEQYNLIGIVGLTDIAIIFVLFTFYPPHLPIFLDPNTYSYGILKK